ncbi:Hypothetical predicted protein [Olea europaea subsp. europaea]|uniref:Uncharacterized protein n=1 Tax=Olea europaea subsp. europaea TaxID=158383 RepID=A0A8S0QLF3_OLEEU|nr:Hypothetical predicted protein [Olea europaea subsp. europaea]
MHGKLPIRNLKGKRVSLATGSDPARGILGDKQKRIRGDTLINKVGVGIYNLTKEKILRIEMPQTASSSAATNSSNIDTGNA